jgi:hypothetical protein
MPGGQVGRVDDDAAFDVDRSGCSDPDTGHAIARCTGLGDHVLDRGRDPVDQDLRVVGVRRTHTATRDHFAGEVEYDDGHDRGVEVNADGVLAGGIQLEQCARLAQAGALLPTGFTE